jgi:hypothetical protein
MHQAIEIIVEWKPYRRAETSILYKTSAKSYGRMAT